MSFIMIIISLETKKIFYDWMSKVFSGLMKTSPQQLGIVSHDKLLLDDEKVLRFHAL